MAMNIRGLFRPNISLVKCILLKPNFINVGVRCLFSEKDLGVTSYEHARFVFRNQFMTIEDTFRIKMREICEQEDGIVYTEDLKAMLHLVQENEADMELLNKMILRYVKFKEDKKLATYAVGPVILRMYYYLDKPQHALAMFQDELLVQNFKYRSSVRILICLLYKHNMFKEIREVYEKIEESNGIDFIGVNSVILFASCLKENTPESLEYAINKWKAQHSMAKASVRSTALVSLLALKNNDADTALEMLSSINTEDAITVRCLKLLAYLKLQKYLQIIPLLKRSLDNDNSVRKLNIFADVVYEIEEKVKEENTEECTQVLQLIEKLKKSEHLETFNTLEEFLLRPMYIRTKDDTKNTNRNTNRRFNRTRQELQSYI